jgi:hypothetical protein
MRERDGESQPSGRPELESDRSDITFVVRLWREAAAPSARWRGSIESGGRRYYFSNLGAMCEFMIAQREGR